MKRSFLLCVQLLPLLGAIACGGVALAPGGGLPDASTTPDGSSSSPPDGGTGGAPDSGGDSGVKKDGGTTGCTGTAPYCFGLAPSLCCDDTPHGTATCSGSTWMCGATEAPGCTGVSCMPPPRDAGHDASTVCTGAVPRCYGSQSSGCCSATSTGVAACDGGIWTCGAAEAPGCNQTFCAGVDAGPPNDCSPPCGANQICVGKQVVGGAQIPLVDGGTCPVGTVFNGYSCDRVPTFSCAPAPAGCGLGIPCICAAECVGAQVCDSVVASEVICVTEVP